MSYFCRKVVEYMYDSRLNQFITSFQEIYSRYKYLDPETFFREWFDRFIIRELVFYFSPSALIRSFEEVKTKRARLYETYVKTYWSACRKYPAKVEEAVRFFGLKELSEEELKSRYRKLVKRFHPDRAGKSQETHRNMVKINYYYQLLRRFLRDRRLQTAEIG
jgi:hypothetical protein